MCETKLTSLLDFLNCGKMCSRKYTTFFGFLVGALLIVPAWGQGCIYPSQPFPKVVETEPAGRVLVEFQVRLSREVWALNSAVLDGYVAVERENDTVRLVTIKPLDLEEMNTANPSVGTRLKVTLSCTFDNRPLITQDVNVLITARNEFDPHFISAPYYQDIEENSAVGTTVFVLDGRAEDRDFMPLQQPISQFRLYGIQPQAQKTYFAMIGTIQGIITTQNQLDYEALAEKGLTSFVLNVSAEDNGEPGPRSVFTTITVNVIDVDDENPAFVYNCQCAQTDCPPRIKGLCQVPAYYSTITATSSGVLSVQPSRIYAVDGDMLNDTIEYSIVAGSLQNHSKYFTINNETGDVTQIRQVGDMEINNFVLTIQATEVSTARRQAIRGLTISVADRTGEPPLFPPDTTPYRNTTEPPLSSTEAGNGSIALWVLLVAIGSCLLLGILVAFGVYIFLRKRHKTNVHPDDTQSSGPSNVSTEEEILDAYASEATENKWGASNLDLSVRSAYGLNNGFTNDVHKENYINGEMTNRGNLSPRPYDIAVPLSNGTFPPLNKSDMVDTSTETEETDIRKMKRKPRRRKTKEEEIYDGTRTYEMEADPSFFTSVPKQKVKRSRRSFKSKNAPDHWITVPNEY